MARIASRRGGAVIRSSARKNRSWVGATSSTPQSVATDTAVVVEIASAATIDAVGRQGHIVRTRGSIQCRANTGAEDPMVLWAIGLFHDGLTTAASFPQPDDETREPYFAWGAAYGQTGVAFEVQPGGHVIIDSKAKRRFQSDDRVVLLLKGMASGHTALIMFDVDVLLVLDQGA